MGFGVPQFEWREEEGRYMAMHIRSQAPWTTISTGSRATRERRAKAYDIVLNGVESAAVIRIHSQELQNAHVRALASGSSRRCTASAS